MNKGILALIGLSLAGLVVVAGRWSAAPAWLAEGVLWAEILVAAAAGVRPARGWHPVVAAGWLCGPTALTLFFAGDEQNLWLVGVVVVAAAFGAAIASGLAGRWFGRRLGIPAAPPVMLHDPPFPQR